MSTVCATERSWLYTEKKECKLQNKYFHEINCTTVLHACTKLNFIIFHCLRHSMHIYSQRYMYVSKLNLLSLIRYKCIVPTPDLIAELAYLKLYTSPKEKQILCKYLAISNTCSPAIKRYLPEHILKPKISIVSFTISIQFFHPELTPGITTSFVNMLLLKGLM